jgi:hypothetical protein
MSDDKPDKCPDCGMDSPVRIITTANRAIFKGNGWPDKGEY